MAIIHDGSMLSPVSEAVCLCMPVAGELILEKTIVFCLWASHRPLADCYGKQDAGVGGPLL